MKLKEKQIKYIFNSQALLQQNDAIFRNTPKVKSSNIKGGEVEQGKESSELFLATIDGCAEPCYESYRVMGGE